MVPCLSSGFTKLTKLCPCLSYFPQFFGHFESLAFFQKWGDKPHTKAVKQDVCSQLLKVEQLSPFFKKAQLFWEKSEDKPNIRWMSKIFQWKTVFLWKALCFFGLFPRDKGDYTDVWMIKINQNDFLFPFFSLLFFFYFYGNSARVSWQL